MCLIIDRPAGVEIPFEKLKTAMKNNPDGYGLAVPEGNGLLYVERQVEMPEPEELWEYLHGEFKDDKILVHLRYTTKGSTSLRNTHPFPVLELKADGVDLRMAHNGTIHKYSPTGNSDNSSDTRNFVKTFVRPLFKRLVKGNDINELMKDPFLIKLLDDQIPANSVLSFMDGHGNSFQVNPKGNGAFVDEETGIWYSNKYSFNENHRTPTQNYYQGPTGYYQGPKGGSSVPLSNRNTTSPTGGTTSSTSTALVGKNKSTAQVGHALDTKREYFSEKFGVDLEELLLMSDETIDTIVEDHPKEAKLLIMELLHEYKKLSDLLSKKKAN